MQNSRIEWIISPQFYYGCASLLLIFPFRLIVSWFLAAAVHELCHYTVLRLCNVKVTQIRIGMLGAVITTEEIPSYYYEMLAALGGPAGGLLLLIFARQMPYVAICALFQSLFNLLPIYPLDGGRAVRNLLLLLFKEKGLIIYRVIKILIYFVLFVISGVALLFGAGWIPLIISITLFIKTRKEIPLANGLK